MCLLMRVDSKTLRNAEVLCARPQESTSLSRLLIVYHIRDRQRRRDRTATYMHEHRALITALPDSRLSDSVLILIVYLRCIILVEM